MCHLKPQQVEHCQGTLRQRSRAILGQNPMGNPLFPKRLRLKSIRFIFSFNSHHKIFCFREEKQKAFDLLRKRPSSKLASDLIVVLFCNSAV